LKQKHKEKNSEARATQIKATNLTAAFTAATADYGVMTHDEVYD